MSITILQNEYDLNTTMLNLSHSELTVIPEEVFLLTKLVYLNLSRNKLHTIPKDVHKLKNLETLVIFSNEINELRFKF